MRVATDAKFKYRHDTFGDGEYGFRQTPSLVLEAQYLTERYGSPYGRFGVAMRAVVGESFEYDYGTGKKSYNGDHAGIALMYMY